DELVEVRLDLGRGAHAVLAEQDHVHRGPTRESCAGDGAGGRGEPGGDDDRAKGDTHRKDLLLPRWTVAHTRYALRVPGPQRFGRRESVPPGRATLACSPGCTGGESRRRDRATALAL